MYSYIINIFFVYFNEVGGGGALIKNLKVKRVGVLITVRVLFLRKLTWGP